VADVQPDRDGTLTVVGAAFLTGDGSILVGRAS